MFKSSSRIGFGVRSAGKSARCLSTPARSAARDSSVHMLGVQGAGMRPAAAVAMAQGYVVRGSDDAKTGNLHDLDGLKIMHGGLQDTDLPDVIVASAALSSSHPDLEMAKKHRVPVLSRRQWFRRSLQDFCQVSVVGTHGKTTTSSMIAYILHKMGLKVPFLVGGDIPQLPLSSISAPGTDMNGLLVVEGDEYGQAFLGLSPMVSVLTNVGYDHVDQFRLQCGGVLLANGDDEGCRRVVNQAAAYNGIVTWQDFVGMGSQERACSKLVLFYGFSKFNDISLHAADPVLDQQASSRSHNAPWFSATRMMWAIPEYRHEEAFMGHDWAFASHFEYHVQLLGDHNVSNAAAAVLASAISGAMYRHSYSTACEALATGMSEVFDSLQNASQLAHSFTGPHRRLECLKSTTVHKENSQTCIHVYDDYAHHPTEIVASLQALKQTHPQAVFWVVWEPITRSRLEHFMPAFVGAFTRSTSITKLITGPIDVAREDDDPEEDCHLLHQLEMQLNSCMDPACATVTHSWNEVNVELLSHVAGELGVDRDSEVAVVFMGASKVTHAAHAFVDSDAVRSLVVLGEDMPKTK